MENIAIPGNLDTLSAELRKSKRLAILGVGAELMQDDRAGCEITLAMEKKYGTEHPNVRMFTSYSVPENFTKDIAEYNPDHVLIIDAADLKMAPGTLINLPVERVTDYSLGTHKLSLIMMIRFLQESIHPQFSVLAIQYKSIEFAEPMTRQMKAAVRTSCKFLSEIIETL